jgi:hypothetical protein
MPSPARAKEVCLLTVVTGESQTHLCVIGTFRGAYKLALFEAAISFPNLSERAAQTLMNQAGSVKLWDTKKFAYEEEARWSPIGKIISVCKVPVKHT